MNKEFVCAECGHEQDSMDRRCDHCKSRQVVLISVVAQLFGADWRQSFKVREPS